MGLGVGLTAGALSVRYRDVQYVLPVAIQFLLFASPIAYSVSSAPAKSQWFLEANPLTGLLEGMRWSTIGTPLPSAALIAYSAIASLGIFVVGVLVFSRLERQFADVI
jgi:lipopolysaccharide transport system permease protein